MSHGRSFDLVQSASSRSSALTHAPRRTPHRRRHRVARRCHARRRWLRPGARRARARRSSCAPAIPLSRARAACDLRELGDRAADAIAPLVALMDDATPLKADVCEKNRNWGGRDGDLTTPGEQAAAALVAIGSRSFAPLLGALQFAGVGRPPQRRLGARRAPRRARGAAAHRRAERSRSAGPRAGVLGARRAARSAGHCARSSRPSKDREPLGARADRLGLGALAATATAVPALVKALEDADPRVRRQTAWALGALRDPRAAEPLAAALKDRDASVREQAAWASGALRDRTSVPPLIALLGDSRGRASAVRPPGRSAPSAMPGPRAAPHRAQGRRPVGPSSGCLGHRSRQQVTLVGIRDPGRRPLVR